MKSKMVEQKGFRHLPAITGRQIRIPKQSEDLKSKMVEQKGFRHSAAITGR
jgi:hypothetical protein